jgi:hypothetical protein
MRVETWADPMRRPGWRGPPRLVCKEDDVNEQKFATYFKKNEGFLEKFAICENLGPQPDQNPGPR